ncbi:Interferon-induced very large GTPase 1 [Holothuria leucospilota]|uniref:Interferon-induced very large GTPase 1 n=1 Tax=Holothuria leucospilota TaxID=206669 RepID=A0A9Q0YJ53_HOLLE|nr:Interferon-induced very large GTPase 1 [Holothuria leucospilota]
MEELHKRVLDKSIIDLENDLQPMDVTSELISKEIMKTDDIEVLERKPSGKSRVWEFIIILKRRGPEAFPAFLHVLKTIPYYKTLLQTLEDHERTLKTQTENKIKELVTSADTKDTFAFVQMKLNLAEHLDKRDSMQLCGLLKLSKEICEEIHRSPNPGITFIRGVGNLEFIATDGVTSILKALENLSLKDAAEVVKDYVEELSFPEVLLGASVRSSVDVIRSTPRYDMDDIFLQERVESFHTWQRLRKFFQNLYAVRLFDLRKESIVLVLNISTVDNLGKLESDIRSGDLAQQLQPIFLKESNQKSGDEHPIRINLTYDHRQFQEVKQKLTHQDKFHEEVFPTYIPPQEELQEGSTLKSSAKNRSFSDLLETLGLNNMFPGRLSLKKFIKVNNRQSIENESDFVFLFWQKLSSLDSQIRSKIFLKLNDSSPAHPVSIRDFTFAVMQCSNRFLRQDIIEKMSACHLAVPVVLHGISKQKPEFLLWSLRRTVKKWKESNSIALEQHIVHVPVFTVSFLRIGEISTVSKSSIINSFLGPYQGNDVHPFFLTKEEDLCNPSFSKGCIESVWYLPMNTNGSEKLKWITCFHNLRGDCTKFPMQTEFACKAANVTIIFIAIKSLETYQETIKLIKSSSNSFFFIGINDECDKALQKKYTQPRQGWLYYHSLELEDILDKISETITDCHASCSTDKYTKLDGLVELCCKDRINNEEDVKECIDAKVHVKQIIDIGTKEDLSDFKERVFPLKATWVDWVSIDKERLRPDAEREESVEFSRDDIARRKAEKRQQQLDSGLSETMKIFMRVLRDSQSNMENLDYFLFYLQETLFRLADEATKDHFKKIASFDEEIQKLDALIKPKPQRVPDTSKTEVVKTTETESRYKQERLRWKSLRQEEHEKCMEKNIGWEHFLRELGQWHEAHTELKVDKDELCMSLPGIASKLVCHGYSIEIMDGDTGRLPVSWITSVLDKLAQDLEDPNILVLSVIGVQSSGKSTLLNSMFGVKFPVRAGRCTRGLFMQMLTVDEIYVKNLGLKYILLIDSEGIRSFERNSKEECRFDNELVTLALCISDVTILNVEGENIGPEMTGILEIAAHASIRMTEKELYSQCRIIQQRVSDLTASERNKINMNQIVEMLNEAVRVASKEEGYGDRYEKFSDVVGLRLDDNLQFIPCLWTGPMSPPSQFYSDVVTKVKEDIFCEIERKKVIPQFSVSSFNQRIRDVWRAVKDEKFLFNFQDSIKAVDFNNMCMELSKHFTDMRLSLVEKRVEWHKRIQSSVGEPDETLGTIQEDCRREVQAKKEGIQSAMSSFISQHKRKII